MWHHYDGLDLRDLWRPGGGKSGLTWRMLRDFIRHLPPESATMTALRNADPDAMKTGGDPAEGRWSQAEMLLAAIHDAVRNLEWTYATAHTPKKAKRPKQPDPIPRPGATRKPQRKLTGDQYERLYNHINGLPGGPQLELIQGGKGRDQGGDRGGG